MSQLVLDKDWCNALALAGPGYVSGVNKPARVGRILNEHSLDDKGEPNEGGRFVANEAVGIAQEKPSLLILCFSKLVSDARILKQIEMLRDSYRITTCGYGPATTPGIRHLRIPDSAPATLNGKLITFGQRLLSYWAMPSVRWVKHHVPQGQFDVVLANDLEAVPVAITLKPLMGVHADLHEYSPGIHDDRELWMKRVYPVFDLLCKRYLTKASSFTTTSDAFADKYRSTYGVDASVVPNAAPFRDAKPTPVGDTIRLVHGGVCLRSRHLDTMIVGVQESDADVTFDFFLMPNDPAYLQELRDIATSDPRITIHPGVPHAELLDTLARYDVGVHLLYPSSFNNRWALPNKIFQNVQARLGMISGPTPEMVPIIKEFGFGAITDDFSSEALTRTLNSLTRDQVREWKEAADVAAPALASEVLCLGWQQEIDALVESSRSTTQV